MPELSEQLVALIDAAPAITVDAIRVRGRARERRRAMLVAGAAAVVVAGSVIGVVALTRGTNHHEPGRVAVAPPTMTPRTPAVGPISSHIELSRRSVNAGETIAATLVVDNRTGRAVRLVDGRGCAAKIAIALGNEKIPPQVSFFKNCGGSPTVIRVGESRLPFTVRSTYSGCATGPGAIAVPTCLPSGGLPPLPPGEYRATLVDSSTQLPSPPPIPVEVQVQP
jgi:hypothetical protein